MIFFNWHTSRTTHVSSCSVSQASAGYAATHCAVVGMSSITLSFLRLVAVVHVCTFIAQCVCTSVVGDEISLRVHSTCQTSIPEPCGARPGLNEMHNSDTGNRPSLERAEMGTVYLIQQLRVFTTGNCRRPRSFEQECPTSHKGQEDQMTAR